MVGGHIGWYAIGCSLLSDTTSNEMMKLMKLQLFNFNSVIDYLVVISSIEVDEDHFCLTGRSLPRSLRRQLTLSACWKEVHPSDVRTRVVHPSFSFSFLTATFFSVLICTSK